MGRPTKYNKNFHPEEYLRLSRAGKTKTQIADEWDIDFDTIDNWGRKHKEFFGAIKRGRKALEAWYTNFGMNIAAGKMPKANVTAYIWLTKNCIDWRDKKEIQHSVDDIDFEDDDDV